MEACFKNTKQLEKEEKKEDNKGKENNKSTIGTIVENTKD